MLTVYFISLYILAIQGVNRKTLDLVLFKDSAHAVRLDLVKAFKPSPVEHLVVFGYR